MPRLSQLAKMKESVHFRVKMNVVSGLHGIVCAAGYFVVRGSVESNVAIVEKGERNIECGKECKRKVILEVGIVETVEMCIQSQKLPKECEERMVNAAYFLSTHAN